MTFPELYQVELRFRALKKIDSWQPGTRLDSWMFCIAKNIWIDQIRSQNKRGQQVDMEILDQISNNNGEQHTENQLMLHKAEKAMAKLPTDHKIFECIYDMYLVEFRKAIDDATRQICTII